MEVAPRTDDLNLDSITDREQLTQALQKLYQRAGRPSYRMMETRARQQGLALSKSKAPQVLRTGTPLRKETLVAFVRVCGVPPDQVEPWARAWERADDAVGGSVADRAASEEQARQQALRLLEIATEKAEEIVQQGHDRAAQLRVRGLQEAEEIREAAHQQAQGQLEQAHQEAQAVLERARPAVEEWKAQALAELNARAEEILQDAVKRGRLILVDAERRANKAAQDILDRAHHAAEHRRMAVPLDADPLAPPGETVDMGGYHMDAAARVLAIAQNTADTAIAAARREAELTVSQARTEALRILEEARLTRDSTTPIVLALPPQADDEAPGTAPADADPPREGAFNRLREVSNQPPLPLGGTQAATSQSQ
ncbi:hypothetical protein GCM10009678_86580 [Actinomadura kijaniata]|uniref:Vacuolar-type H+-ATPase subunit H n=1 Tax=Actinomadura namibiensis TaxID=182080 RepID=A0A7W3M0I3_ACTNM|nr:hypothetical protein [Actinomadura namibiensis]MBA8957725.1 vacuolar-type H+-ATPase subunit H [Actinomadura namibiensis]